MVVAAWWGGVLDNPCGGGITGSCCFRSSYRYQCGAILSADVCVDAVHKLSVGRKPRVCTCVLYNSEGYKLHYLYRGMIGTYIYGIIQWSAGSMRGVRVLPVV